MYKKRFLCEVCSADFEVHHEDVYDPVAHCPFCGEDIEDNDDYDEYDGIAFDR